VETAVVGLTGLTTDDQEGTPEPGRHHHRRDVHPHPSNAVVVRQWHGRDSGLGGNTVFLTNAPVDQPMQPFDANDDRRRLENCAIQESQPPWRVPHPPQKTARAVHVHVLFTLLRSCICVLRVTQMDLARAGRVVNQPVMSASIGVPGSDATLFACRRAHLARSAFRCFPSSVAYTAYGCGHGGARHSSTARQVQT
jgi:hypothetical protein